MDIEQILGHLRGILDEMEKLGKDSHCAVKTAKGFLNAVLYLLEGAQYELSGDKEMFYNMMNLTSREMAKAQYTFTHGGEQPWMNRAWRTAFDDRKV
jgi:hypothetical protein